MTKQEECLHKLGLFKELLTSTMQTALHGRHFHSIEFLMISVDANFLTRRAPFSWVWLFLAETPFAGILKTKGEGKTPRLNSVLFVLSDTIQVQQQQSFAGAQIMH